MSKRVTIEDRNLLFHIWDTAGQEKVGVPFKRILRDFAFF